MPEEITKKYFKKKDSDAFMKHLLAEIKDTFLRTHDYLIIVNGQYKDGNYGLTVKQVGLEHFKDDVDLLLAKWKGVEQGKIHQKKEN